MTCSIVSKNCTELATSTNVMKGKAQSPNKRGSVVSYVTKWFGDWNEAMFRFS